MINKPTAIIAALAIDRLFQAVLRRFGKPVHRVLLRPPQPLYWASQSSSYYRNPRGAAVAGKASSSTEVCQLAGHGQQVESMLAELDV
jgi:hypothetical protein